jgi:hypothetical protein
MLNDVLNLLEHEWRDSLNQSGVEIHPPLSALKISNNDLTLRKVNFFVFNHRERQPVLVLRLVQLDEQRAFLKNEYETLGKLVRHEPLSPAIPHPVGLFELDNTLVAVESIVPGISLFTLLCRRKHTRPFEVKRDLRLACDFLYDLEQATLDSYLPFPGADMVGSKLEQLRSTYGSMVIPKSCEQQLLEIANEYRSLRMPRCGRHGDYWPGNFYLSPRGTGVIDWEAFTHPDTLFHDIFFFTTTYALFYPWHGWGSCSPEEAFGLGFIERNWLSAIIRETLERFFLKLNIPSRAMYLLFNLFLIEMALPSAIKNDPRNPPQHSKWFSLLQIMIQNAPPTPPNDGEVIMSKVHHEG